MGRFTFCSFNMLNANQYLDKVLDFLCTLHDRNWNIITCLQEVPKWFLLSLEEISECCATHGIEVTHATKECVSDYLVILSRHPIIGHKRIALPELAPPKLRARCFTACTGIGDQRGKDTNRGFTYSDLDIDGVLLRVFNAHLPLATPAERMRDLHLIAEHSVPNRKSIICGDFNTLGNPALKALNFALGGPFITATPWYSERAEIERYCAQHRLSDPLAGKITFRKGPLRDGPLDHILVPNDLNVVCARVSKDRRGSDHYPVSVMVEL